MKILVVSDNHRDETVLYDLLEIYEDIDLWLHCGDSEFSENHPLWETYQTVQGNMDWALFDETFVTTLDTTTIAVLHGHKHKVKRTLDKMEKIAVSNSASVVFYGHSHVAKVDKQEGVFYINPGSISQPRGDLRVGSYAIYEEKNGEKLIHFYDWNHHEIPSLSQILE